MGYIHFNGSVHTSSTENQGKKNIRIHDHLVWTHPKGLDSFDR